MGSERDDERWRNEPMKCPICGCEWRAVYQVFPPWEAENPNTTPCPDCGVAPEQEEATCEPS